MIAIIRYGAGNVSSVQCALERIQAPSVITDDPKTIREASHIIFPGVGEASTAMEYLKASGLETVIKECRRPFLGICLGMQLMCRYSEENSTDCIGIFNTDVGLIKSNNIYKVPHMGWNSIEPSQDALFESIPDGEMFYFVHSYAVPLQDGTIASCDYAGMSFSAAIRHKNFVGVQFHPEKSGSAGSQLLQNFLVQEESICL